MSNANKIQYHIAQRARLLKSEPPVRSSDLVSCVGSQPPKGYISWHTWAEKQHKAGLRQRRCARCGLWKFPQEMSALEVTHKGTTRKHGGAVIITNHKVCNECVANAGTDTNRVPANAPHCRLKWFLARRKNVAEWEKDEKLAREMKESLEHARRYNEPSSARTR